jgi:hypothetical protein
MNNVTDFIYKTWTSTRKTRVSPKGWIHGNAPCCLHNGETKDTRGRGGWKIDEVTGGIVYHCFNCGFKTGYNPGDRLYHKTRKLLGWMGANEGDVNRMAIEALRIRDLSGYVVHAEPKEHKDIDFKKRKLPEGALSFNEWMTWYELKGDNDYPQGLMDAVEYAADRLGNLANMPDLYYTTERAHGDNKIAAMNKRLIIPFMWKDKTVGFTARALNAVKPKYLMEVDSNYVFGTDRLVKDSEFVLVFEGPIDAMLMNGLAVLSNTVSAEQADLIEGLGKKVIVVPDLNHTGIPLMDAAAEYGWSVSFPEWEEDIKDAGEAVQRYGKLFTLKTIISNILSSKLKIDLYKRKLNG